MLAYVEQLPWDEEPPSIDWEVVQRWHAADQVVEMRVVDWNRGGLLVKNEHAQGFLPFSHLVSVGHPDRPPTPEDGRALLGRTLCLKVLEFNPDQQRLVFSERAAQAEPGCRHRLLRSLRPGERVRGTVSLLTRFGAFVDLGGVEGLIHISELSWGRVSHPADVLHVGEEVEVLVLDVDWEHKRLPLSRKRLLPNPWEDSPRRFPPGSEVVGEISRVAPYGVFVRLEEGIEGLIHASQMACPPRTLTAGMPVRAEVLQVDPKRHRLSLRLVEALSPEQVPA